MSGDLPKIEFKAWPVKVSVWEQTKKGDGGREYIEHSFTLSKTFKKQDGGGYEERKLVLFPEDALLAISLLQQAFQVTCVDAHVPERKQQGGGRSRR